MRGYEVLGLLVRLALGLHVHTTYVYTQNRFLKLTVSPQRPETKQPVRLRALGIFCVSAAAKGSETGSCELVF